MTKELALSLIEGKDVIYLTEEGRKMIEAILSGKENHNDLSPHSEV